MRIPRPPSLALGGLVGLGLVAGAYLAYAQVSNVAGPLSGGEAVVVAQGVPGGPSYFTTSGRLSTGGFVYLAAFPTSFTIGQVAGGTTTPTAGVANGGLIGINAANTAQTFTLPPNPVIDGTQIGICNLTAAAWVTNAVTVAANSGQSLVGSGTLTTQAAGTCAKFAWAQAPLTWFRTQ